VVIYSPKPHETPVPPDDIESPDTEGGAEHVGEAGGEWISADGGESTGPRAFDPRKVKKYYVSNVEVSVAAERVQYFDAHGKLITESLKDYTRKAIGREFESLDEFLRKWSGAEKKQAVVEELENAGIFLDALSEEIGRDLDPFDIVCHIAWDRPPLTRRERAENVRKKDYFARYGGTARRVLDALLDKYADEGIGHIEETRILTINPFTEFGTPVEIIKTFGGIEKYEEAVRELERAIYLA
jgi:type I restriction enzyme R subunit